MKLAEVVDILNSAASRRDWQETESVARTALAQAKHYVFHLFLIEALIRTGRPAEAEREFADLMSYKFNLDKHITQFPLIAHLYRNKLSKHYVMNTMRTHSSLESVEMENVVTRWHMKHMMTTREEFLSEAGKIFDAALPSVVPSDRATASICTFGSCFAANLARILIAQGMTANSLLIEESINSTYANRALLEIVCGRPSGQAHADMRAEYGDPFFETVHEKLRSASDIVLTVGVAPSFFAVEDGAFVFAKNYRTLLEAGKIRMRTTTCGENIENLRHIVALMNEIAPTARKIITVSPVPLAGTTEMPSVVVADCVSKSTLRAAVHEVTDADPSLTYFPAFEIVRWLSAYTSTEVYGADDRFSRHVSNWVVEFIVSSFIERFFTAEAGAA
jgi:hypothetical protein